MCRQIWGDSLVILRAEVNFLIINSPSCPPPLQAQPISLPPPRGSFSPFVYLFSIFTLSWPILKRENCRVGKIKVFCAYAKSRCALVSVADAKMRVAHTYFCHLGLDYLNNSGVNIPSCFPSSHPYIFPVVFYLVILVKLVKKNKIKCIKGITRFHKQWFLSFTVVQEWMQSEIQFFDILQWGSASVRYKRSRRGGFGQSGSKLCQQYLFHWITSSWISYERMTDNGSVHQLYWMALMSHNDFWSGPSFIKHICKCRQKNDLIYIHIPDGEQLPWVRACCSQ